MKTAEELNTLKEEVETVRRKLTELTDEELEQVTGGISIVQPSNCHHKGSFAYRSGYFNVYGYDINCGNECVHFMGGDGGCDLD